MPASQVERDDESRNKYFKEIIEGIKQGEVIPILSSDINLCGRPKDKNGRPIDWDEKYSPCSYELATYLAGLDDSGYHISCPLCQEVECGLPSGCPLNYKDAITKLALANVSQHLALCAPSTLDSTIKYIIKARFPPNPVHRFLANLPRMLRDNNYAPPYPLFVTTCLDRSLELAFEEAKQCYHVVAFLGNDSGGIFVHTKVNADGDQESIDNIKVPAEYTEVSLEERPVILKLYGGVSFGLDTNNKYSISEDHYIDYLTQRSIEQLLPPNLLSILKEKGRKLLFLEYSLSHWNLRVILHRIWRDQLDSQAKKWWSVQEYPERIDEKFWSKYSVANIIEPMEGFIAELNSQLIAELTPKDKQSKPDSEMVTDIDHITQRRGVFISYSRADRKWVDRFKDMLGPQDDEYCWDDKMIEAGEEWEEAICNAMTKAKVAVLFVSPAYLNSAFINKQELPPLLEAAKKEGLIIFILLVTHCILERSGLEHYNAAIDYSKPLDSYRRTSDVNKVLKEAALKLTNILNKEQQHL